MPCLSGHHKIRMQLPGNYDPSLYQMLALHLHTPDLRLSSIGALANVHLAQGGRGQVGGVAQQRHAAAAVRLAVAQLAIFYV